MRQRDVVRHVALSCFCREVVSKKTIVKTSSRTLLFRLAASQLRSVIGGGRNKAINARGRQEPMHYSDQYVKTFACDSRYAGGWVALYRSLQGGVPHAFDIVKVLRSRGFTFPWIPEFSFTDTELQCYRVIHQAWREKLLPDLLSLLQAWEEEGRLASHARRPEFQIAVLGFRRGMRHVEIGQVTDCFRRTNESKVRLSELSEMSTTREIEAQLNAIWLCLGDRNLH